jgi:hypothetical protein
MSRFSWFPSVSIQQEIKRAVMLGGALPVAHALLLAVPCAALSPLTGMGSSVAYGRVWHAYLADSREKVKYPVAKDQRSARQSRCWARHGPRKVVLLEPKQAVSTWAKFINVPPDVKKISVFIPGVQPFEDVTISE